MSYRSMDTELQFREMKCSRNGDTTCACPNAHEHPATVTIASFMVYLFYGHY